MNIKRWLSALFILLVVIFSLGFVKFSQIQQAIAFGESFPEPSASVESTYAEVSQYTKTTKVIGQIKAIKTLTISNEYPGTISFIDFNPGDVVSKDQILLKLDSSEEQANLAAASARLKLANKNYQRLIKLLKKKRISQDQVDQADAEVSINQAEIKRLSSIIAKKVIRAPFAGTVGLTSHQIGQLLQTGSQITSLVGLDEEIWVDFSIPQTLPQLAIGDQVEVSLIATNQNRAATVIAKQASLNANSRQQSYRAIIKNPDNALINNQIVNVYAPQPSTTVVMVPTNAVIRNSFGNFVYQLVKDEQENWRAKSVQVELGNQVDNQQVVLTGLTGDEFIASAGAFKLRDNLLVYTQAPILTTAVEGH